MRFYQKNKKIVNITLGITAFLLIISTALFSFYPTVFYNTVGFVVTPIQNFSSNTKDYFNDVINGFKNKDYLQEYNEILVSENEQLELELSRLSNVQKENEELTSLLDATTKYPSYDTVSATVIGKDPTNWYNTFIVNAGYEDGVEVGMPVISNGGLVGKVSEVSPNSSKITTVIDNSFAVSVVSSRTNDLGMVKGDLSLVHDNLALLEFYDQESEIIEGDELVTSDISSVFPPGIPVGIVHSINDSQSSLTKTAIIKPFVDFDSLDHLLIITNDFSKEMYEENDAYDHITSSIPNDERESSDSEEK